MTDRKQEAIRVIAGILYPSQTIQAQLSDLQHQRDQHTAMTQAEVIYNRLALLMVQEFPEEAIRRVVLRYLGGCKNIRDNQCSTERLYSDSIYGEQIGTLIQLCIDNLKRLWEGQSYVEELGKNVGLRPDAQDEMNKQASRGLAKIEATKRREGYLETRPPAEVIKEIESRKGQAAKEFQSDPHTIVKGPYGELKLFDPPNLKRPKGTCQKCGGKRRVPIPRKSLEQENKYWGDCPACGGTGECQHENRYPHFRNHYRGPKFYWCDDCKQAIMTERSGEERRVFKETFNGGRRNYDYEGVALFVDVVGKGYVEQQHYDRRTLKDRRTRLEGE